MLQMCTLNVVQNVYPENVFNRVQRVSFVKLVSSPKEKDILALSKFVKEAKVT